ncbi:hypothetical protein BT63DRAFT_440763 [Microthyrium microscopicum]|uniref:Biogenesis of lysosome-related organelles complex 1 subunit 1 n=1 Tax=Microthyrium microscopicum TaxID=703497 RepID=A0A6A6UC08_9PEZI|nr:hypothetical protein BT63DRAFT_440763 [Microthyrium microscopicum]
MHNPGNKLLCSRSSGVALTSKLRPLSTALTTSLDLIRASRSLARMTQASVPEQLNASSGESSQSTQLTAAPPAPSSSSTTPSQLTSTSPNPSSSSPPTSVQTNEQSLTEARAAVTATLASVGAHIDSDLQARASDIHSNAGALAEQEKTLRAQTAALAKQSGRWQKEMDSSVKKLKELGDVQNWAEVLERDLLVLEETMRLVDGSPDEGLASGTNAPVQGVGNNARPE